MPPLGVVRMQLEALANLQQRAAISRPRRSLPDVEVASANANNTLAAVRNLQVRSNSIAAAAAATEQQQQQHQKSSQAVAVVDLVRSDSETTATTTTGNSGSVSRLRKQLEKKAVLPLTGSIAPYVSAAATADGNKSTTSPTRQLPPPFVALRQRSFSADKMNYVSSSSNPTSPGIAAFKPFPFLLLIFNVHILIAE